MHHCWCTCAEKLQIIPRSLQCSFVLSNAKEAHNSASHLVCQDMLTTSFCLSLGPEPGKTFHDLLRAYSAQLGRGLQWSFRTFKGLQEPSRTLWGLPRLFQGLPGPSRAFQDHQGPSKSLPGPSGAFLGLKGPSWAFKGSPRVFQDLQGLTRVFKESSRAFLDERGSWTSFQMFGLLMVKCTFVLCCLNFISWIVTR